VIDGKAGDVRLVARRRRTSGWMITGRAAAPRDARLAPDQSGAWVAGIGGFS
jgi:hypothetical protein